MSEFKGTPGPWFEHREGFSTVYVEARLRQGVIQEVAACGPTESGQEAQYANARLIAVAPELLESLQQCVEWLDIHAHACSSESICADEAKLIIAKALGK
ncbi:hypothetical protein MW376_000223 [Citrobacter freundii]|nr:hypothetical protein [Citrobacter freundii]EJB8558134.1 hypothetical protein [Citrobacter freundii]